MTQVSKAKSYNKEEISEILHPLIREWFFSKFEDFSPAQSFGVMNIHKKQDILISAPTGGGKTLTAFLSILNNLVTMASNKELEDKVYAVYVSPLKALNNDIHKNLIEPLNEINGLAKSKGIELQPIRVGIRTGDTSASEKQKMAKTSSELPFTIQMKKSLLKVSVI